MIKRFLKAYLPCRFYYYHNRVLKNTSKTYQDACKFAEEFIATAQNKEHADTGSKDINLMGSYILQINLFTGIFLNTYLPVIKNESLIDWQEQPPSANIGIAGSLACIFHNTVYFIQVAFLKLWSYVLFASPIVFCALEIFIGILGIPLFVIISISYLIWVLTVKIAPTRVLLRNGKFKAHFTAELQRSYLHARVISFVLFLLFLCYKFFT